MKMIKIGSLLLAVTVCLLPKSALAGNIGFEDAVEVNSFEIPNGYQGFTWSGSQGDSSWVLANPSDGETFVGHAHSGAAYAWSNGGAQLSMSGAVFDFNSLWAFAVGGNFPTVSTMTVNGYLAGNLVYSSIVTLGSDYQQFTFNFLGVDSVVFPDVSSQQYYNLVVDDISVNSTSAPDGGTTAVLLGSALLGLAAMRRKFGRA